LRRNLTEPYVTLRDWLFNLHIHTGYWNTIGIIVERVGYCPYNDHVIPGVQETETTSVP
jgi:hypothetical protein